MDQNQLELLLSDLHLGAIRYYDQVGSTNTLAAAWAEQGADDLSLVVADEQTSGRGRVGRAWYSPPGASLAFSLIIHPPRDTGPLILPRLTALGALAVCDALNELYGLPAQIKWPNDVLINRSKVSGVLTEAHWSSDELAAVILGIGINVGVASTSDSGLPKHELAYPAISVESSLGRPVDRMELLHHVLKYLLFWKPRLAVPEFLHNWEARLAFRGEWVQIMPGESGGKDGLPLLLEKRASPITEGKILGLAPDGSLKLLTRPGETTTVGIGEVRLRPV